MTASKRASQDTPLRRWPLTEKRRIVELSLRDGASVSEIARAHGMHPTSLCHWRRLYRSGKLAVDSSPREKFSGPVSSAALLPVAIISERERAVRSSRTAACLATDARAREINVVHLTLSSGATMRFETNQFDAAFIRVLLAELRK